MPYATHWICGNCNFGPMMISNYPSCISCSHQPCSCCTYDTVDGSTLRTESLSSSGNLRTLDHMPSTDCHLNTYTNPSLPLPGATREMLEDLQASIINRATDLYICCSCGDGPKVYQNQGRCVNCDHDVCGYCTHIK
ncbi:hypothetical protein RJZ56_004708 [Blastomyces dermatitidis]|uniref:Uncharacterized protein n=3 Tax=Blastomyces TaxID=229219 RepID=A0A179UC94_BLAGS|nr:uncharacterized protein BDBG_01161 [Blastomyces gilchristii SLH14081]XP_045276051.1 uncharacterized protein BDCG_04167 [Blastomyces dermatitidis ER-3]EGE81638.1 hypothetical protein BDDG_04581 [Blastomyces dermatitidis ATCC 18188]EQL33014.1 hypothetical protein BDFG_04910 [Blastomyces dermatitidis ATCC 26199]EEQ89047.1 hypothetical protein BDCG_04167 [Blastomyces dermatitidis ER-3]OAT04641.1 hypothetical protein BDBG_01161 [Blastomyces gilchristii SLH14081]